MIPSESAQWDPKNRPDSCSVPAQEIKRVVAARQDVPNLVEINQGGQASQYVCCLGGVNGTLWSSERRDP